MQKNQIAISSDLYQIDIKFDTQVRTATETSWVVSYGGKTIPRWRTAAILKIDISSYLSEQQAELSLTNRAMPVCKVVEVLQDFLSKYVDKKFTRDYNVILYLSIFNSFRVIRC